MLGFSGVNLLLPARNTVFIQIYRIKRMAKTKTCTICGGSIEREFYPMREWNIKGPICGDCYSKRIHDHYPGDHIRVNTELDR